MTYTVLQGNNIDVLKTYPDDHFDSIVTDPPYGIDFLGKDWDANTGALETYEECLRVLKPGGHILAFSAARTYHHLAITLEQAGFEIRDQIMWIYSSGFPKSQDVGKSIQRSLGVKETKKPQGPKSSTPRKNNYKNTLAEAQGKNRIVSKDYDDVEIVVPTDPEALQWAGWGTQLKPAHEPIALARKPLGKNLSIAKNCQQWGVGALNIDATRIPTDDVIICGAGNDKTFNKFNAENNVDGPGTGTKINKDVPKWTQAEGGRFPSNVLGEILQEDYQKYFYSPKVSRKERHMGYENAETKEDMLKALNGTWTDSDQKMCYIPHLNSKIFVHGLTHELEKYRQQHNMVSDNTGNNHPTVKPVALMEYLIKLVTPPGGLVLDPFNGSGSTGMAAVGLGYDYVGIDLDPKYVEISLNRIAAWINKDEPKINPKFKELFEDN